ncbi:MAG: hypothetical protein IJI24_00825 [Lachnospiraceae bacterium]|nr:hypothetical protein [Lachnospiraceae bacterium]
MERTAEKSGNIVTLKLCGRMDAGNSERVKRELFSELTDKEPDSVILDAEDLSHVLPGFSPVDVRTVDLVTEGSIVNFWSIPNTVGLA